MKAPLRDFSGLFQVESHASFIRFLWILSVISCLAGLFFGVWAFFADYFDFSQNLETKIFEIFLAVFFTMILPVLGLVVGFTKIRQKAGVYLRGMRVTHHGLEIGTLSLTLNSAGSINIWKKLQSDNNVEGNWVPAKNIEDQALKFVIVLRTKGDGTSLVYFERFVVLSKKEVLYQLIGKNSNQILWNDLVALLNGSFQLLEDTNGIQPNQLFHFLELLADIISICSFSHAPSCTLKIVSSPDSLGDVLAIGMLGGTSIRENSQDLREKKTLENIFDITFARFLRKFLRERNWSYSTEDRDISWDGIGNKTNNESVREPLERKINKRNRI